MAVLVLVMSAGSALLGILSAVGMQGVVEGRADAKHVVHGLVRDTEGRPIIGANVAVVDLGVGGGCEDVYVGSVRTLAAAVRAAGGRTSKRATATTRADGVFSLPVTDRENFSNLLVLATAPGHGATLARIQNKDRLSLKIQEGWPVSVRVMTTEDVAIDRASVTLIPVDVCPEAVQAFSEEVIRRGTTTDDGRLEFRDVPEGIYSLNVAAIGRETSTVLPLVVRRERRSFRVRLASGTSLKGAIEFAQGHATEPVRILALWGNGERIGWSEASVKAGRNEYTIEGLPFGRPVTLQATTSSGAWSRPVVLKSVDPGKRDFAVPLQVAPLRTLRGQLAQGQRPRILTTTLLFPDTMPESARSLVQSISVERDGSFALNNVPPGVTQVRLAAFGFGSLTLSIGDGDRDWLGVLTLPPRPRPSTAPEAEASVVARVVRRPGGRWAELLRVEVSSQAIGQGEGSPEGTEMLYARTPDGVLQLHPRKGGDVRLTVGHPEGGRSVSVTIERQPDRAHAWPKLELQDLLPLRGLTVASGDETPVEGAEVEVDIENGGRGVQRLGWMTVSGPGGNWSFFELPPDHYSLTASASGYVPAVEPQVTLTSVTQGIAHRLILSRPAVILGKVKGLREGHQARVQLLENAANDAGERTVRANANGEFRFDNVKPDIYVIRVQVTGYLPSAWHSSRSLNVEARAGETEEIEIDLHVGIRVTGRAFMGPEPVPDVRLIFGLKSEEVDVSEAVRTDSDGRYELGLPGPGSYSVTMFDMEPHSRQRQSRVTAEILNRETQKLDLHFPAGRLVGRVIDKSKRVLADAEIRVWRKKENVGGGRTLDHVLDVASGEDGAFEVAGLVPGSYTLQVSKDGYATRLEGPVELRSDGEVILKDIVLGGGVAVSLRILGPDGEPLPDANLRAIRVPENVWMEGEAESDEEGIAVLRDMPDGAYTLVASLAGLAPAVVSNVVVAREGEAPLTTLRLTRGGTLDVQVLGLGGLPLPQVYPTLLDESGIDLAWFHMTEVDGERWPAFTDAEGRLVIPNVRPGKYLVGISGFESIRPQPVTVLEDGLAKVILVAR
jgi:hypothetical protein